MFDPNKFKKKVMAGAGKKKVLKKSAQDKKPVQAKKEIQKVVEPGKKLVDGVWIDILLPSEKKIQVECAPGKAELPPVRQINEFSPNDLIVSSRFCVGCIRNAVDHLGTNQEIWFCRRDPDKEGNVEFVMVKDVFKVSQCKWRKESFGAPAPF